MHERSRVPGAGDTALPASDVEGLVLHVGTSSFAFSNTDTVVLASGDVRYSWVSSLNLSVGDTVAVRLTLLDVPPPQAAWVSNTGQILTSDEILLGNQNKTQSQGFTTGAESGGYSLGWVGVHVRRENLEAGETFTVHIYTANASGARDTLVYTLTSPASYTDNAVNRFTAPASATLAANTDYLVVFEGTANLVNDFQLRIADSDAEDSGSATGWSIEDARRSNSTLLASGNAFVISVNNTLPIVTSVSPVSDPGSDDTYGLGDMIDVEVVFSEVVNVTGMPRIQLRVGGSDPATQLKWANYASGTGTDTLLFTYVVLADDMDDNGIYIEENELELNSGTIQDTDGMNTVLTYPRPGTHADHKVDGSLTPPLVPTTWSLIPSGLGDGDSFRLLFIGSSSRDASSSDIAVYNTFIQNLAAAGHADIQAHSATFRMLGSTEDVDARDNTGTTGAGVPIYWLGGAKVADDYADFYDGDWDEEATGRRETGASVSIGTNWKIWTDSAEDGTEAMHTDGTSRALGNAGNQWVMQGSPNGSNSAHGPIASNTASRTTVRGLYGLSGVFTVDASLDNTAPTFLLESTTREVEENSPAGTNVGLPVTATDADDDTLTYTLEGTDAASFEIDSTSGQIQTKSGVTYDYETKEEYSVTVKADDGNGGTATIAVAIDLLDVDETVATPGAPRNVAATAGTGKVRLTWQAPESEGGGAITGYEYQRKEGSGSYGAWTTAETVTFGSNSHSAILVDATTLDHYAVKAETTYTYRVRAVSAGGSGAAAESGEATTGAAMTVKVVVAEPEVFEDEGPVEVTFVAELPATGPNTEKYDLEFEVNAFTEAITAVHTDDYPLFAIEPIFTPSDFQTESGRWVARKPYTVTLVDDAVVEPDETFIVVVQKIAFGGAARPSHPFITVPGDTDTVTVTILNDDYVPEVPAQQFEVLVGETDAGQLPAMDSRDGDTLTWTLTGGADQALFTLSSDGQLSLKTARASLENPGDNNNDGVYELTVQVSDGHHTAVSGDIKVRLIDVAEPPRRPGAPWVWALDDSTDALDVRWPEIEGDAVRSYDLRYREGTGGDWTNGPQDVTGNRATIDGLESGTSYQVQVRATNSKGDSDWSDPTTGYPATVYDIDGIYIYWTERQGSEKLHADAADLGSSMLENACDTGESFRAIWLQPLESSDADEWEADVQTIEGTGTAQYTLRTAPELTGAVALDGFTIIGIRIRGRFGEDWSNWSRAVNLICVPTEDDSGSATGNSSTGSENATSNPLTGFEVVDATAHLDAGAVEDGATLTGIDPAKVYGFRVNVASGAELKSVKLELSGPGPDHRVARTENYKPYSLRGDSDGHEHGAALPAGSYTLTATAYSEKDGGGSQLGTLSIEFTVTGGPLTARFLYEEPQGYHSGSGTTLTVRLSFSEAVSTTPEALRDHALEVTNATVEAVSRVDERSDLWEVRLTPESDATVTVSLSPAADCDAAGAVCTEDGRTLASGAGTAIPGPPPNSTATGAPSISGTEQVGETLTADVTGIDDDDKLTNAVFAYQWLRGDTDIAGANGSSYTLVSEDEGRIIKVRVSFTDNAGHAETRTSDPTGAVAAKPNTKATGAPTIGGIARVGETLTADTSGIDDDDGLDTAVFSYQWVRHDGGTDTEITGANGSSYTLTEADEGQTVKVTVSFTDAEGNAETLTSDPTGVVAAAETAPGRPQDLDREASAPGIKLTWKAPAGSAVTQYVVYRGKLQNGSMNGQPMTKHATIDAAGEAMEYTDADVKAGVEYRYRVAAVNSSGEGKKSNWLDITAEEP